MSNGMRTNVPMQMNPQQQQMQVQGVMTPNQIVVTQQVFKCMLVDNILEYTLFTSYIFHHFFKI